MAKKEEELGGASLYFWGQLWNVGEMSDCDDVCWRSAHEVTLTTVRVAKTEALDLTGNH